DLPAQSFEHFAAFGYEIGNQVIHRRKRPQRCLRARYAAQELTLRYPCPGMVAPISKKGLAASESWIEPPASAASLCASQAPAARGSTVPPLPPGASVSRSAGSSRMRGPSERITSSTRAS